jgi:DNA repair protein RecO (recombination protein O)
MFTHYRTRGFIINKTDRGESDRILTIFTEDFGKLELLAKAERKIKSKLRAGLELFYLSEIEFIQGKVYKTLTDSILIESFPGIRKDLGKLKIAHQISDLLDDLVKGEELDQRIWQLLNETFEVLNNWNIENSLKIENLKLKIVYYYFLWNFLSILGYQLDLYHCVLCHQKIQPKNIYFDPVEGGLVCQQCPVTTEKAKEIDADTIKILRVFLQKDLATLKRLKFEKDKLESLNETSQYYLSEVLRQFE